MKDAGRDAEDLSQNPATTSPEMQGAPSRAVISEGFRSSGRVSLSASTLRSNRGVGDGSASAELSALVSAAGLDAVVRMPGRLPDTERDRLLHRAWLTVQPSAAEGWGLTVVEAAGYGIPTLGFRVPGLVDSIQSGMTGWLIDEPRSEPDKVTALADAIHDLMRGELQAPASRASIAACCRDWAGRFDWASNRRASRSRHAAWARALAVVR